MSRPGPYDEPDRTRLDLHPMEEPRPAAVPRVVEDVDPYARRANLVGKVCTVITMICGLFALVLAVHIVLVIADANPANGFASFVNSFSGGVSLGLRNLFTPNFEKLRVFLNDGVAAVGWLIIGGALTYAIRRFALPGRRSDRYRIIHQ